MLHRPIFLLFCLVPCLVGAQAIDNTLSFKNISADRYFRFNYENDYFSASDLYYTQGARFELVAPALKRFPLSKVLLHPLKGYTRYGIAIEQDGYTPADIGTPVILYGDHPFASCLYLQTFTTTIDTLHRQRFSTSLTTGVIGPAAGGEAVQRGIHSALPGNTEPEGWKNQVHNDILLNYQCDYEKQLLSYGKYVSLDAGVIARAGTFSTKASAGLTLMGGYFDSPFSTTLATRSNIRIYAYEHADVGIVAYDATLQGGMFSTSPYTIPASQLQRITFHNRFGFVVTYRRLWLEYFQSYISDEFRTAKYHVWGGIQIAFGI